MPATATARGMLGGWRLLNFIFRLGEQDGLCQARG